MKILAYLKQYWIHIVVLLVTLYGYMQLVGGLTTKKNYDEDWNLILDDWQVTTVQRNLIRQTALAIADNLGFLYKWWNFNRWYERDKALFDTIKDISSEDMFLVAILYNNGFERDMKADLIRYLDKRYYNQLTNLNTTLN